MEKQGPRKLKSIQIAIPSKKNSTRSQDGLEAWKHPGVVYTLRLLDQFTFRQAKAEKAESMFLEAWNKTLAFVMSGGKFPEKEIEIEEAVVKADPGSDAVAQSRKELGLSV